MGQVDAVGLALNPGKAQKVTATAPTVFPPLTSEGIEPDIATLEHRATIGTRAPERQKRGGRSYAGSLEGGVRPISMGVLFTLAFGEPVSSTQPDATNAATVYRHVWNPIASGKRPVPGTIWTINQDDPDEIIVDKYIGVGLNELAFTIEQNDYLLFTADVVALRNVEGGSAPAITRDSSALWSFDEVGAQISIPSISSGTYQDIALYAWNLAYSNDLQGADQFALGSKEAVKWREGNISSTVGFTAAEDIESHYRRSIADTPELVKIKLFAKGRQLYDAVLSTNDLYESLEVEFKAIEYYTGNVAIDAENPLQDIEIEGTSILDGSGNLMTVTLTNEHDGSDYLAPA